jgi:hypothetical protein
LSRARDNEGIDQRLKAAFHCQPLDLGIVLPCSFHTRRPIMSTKHLIRGIVIVLAFGLVITPVIAVAAEGNPVRVRAPFIPFTVTGACDFDVYWDALMDKGYFTIITEKDATRYLLTGVFKSRLTNLVTGKSVDLITSAQMTQVFYNDGSFEVILQGPFIGWFGFPSNPPLAYVKGRQSLRYDAAGNIVAATQTGLVQDVCGMLRD